jgi:two-component system, chemotaxis family, chemotaxis protein CheY
LGRAASDLRKVLVVDDDSDWREFVRTALEEMGYQTLEAANGESALECLSKETCSVVLLDLNMPGMSGQEVAQRMPKQGTRVVFLTSASPKEAGSALNAGPHYDLPKGASLHQLSLLLQSLEA